jgi:hypothetical protein
MEITSPTVDRSNADGLTAARSQLQKAAAVQKGSLLRVSSATWRGSGDQDNPLVHRIVECVLSTGPDVNRIYRPNTWQHRPSLQREESPCQSGAVHTWHF